MSEDRFIAIEGKIAALELVVPMIAAYLSVFDSTVRLTLVRDLESLAAGYEFPPGRHPMFVNNFTGTIAEVASKLRESP